MKKTVGRVALFILVLAVSVVWAYNIGTINSIYTPTKVYEDGSYYGCIKGELCND